MNVRQIIELNMAQGRRVLAEARQRVAELTGSTVFTPEYKTAATTALREQVTTAIQHGLVNARAAAGAAEREARQALERLTVVDDAVLAARVPVLAPLLQAANSRPAVLINAYLHRFEHPVDRRILEEAIGAMLDAVEPTERQQLQELFRQVQQETATRKSPEEQQADAAVDTAQALIGYVEQISTVLLTEAKEALGVPLTSLEAVAHANAAAAVANFPPAAVAGGSV